MKRGLSNILVDGLKASGYICVALLLLWFALSFVGIVLYTWFSLKNPLFGQVLWFYSAILYPLFVLSVPIGQAYSFLVYWRRQTKNEASK